MKQAQILSVSLIVAGVCFISSCSSIGSEQVTDTQHPNGRKEKHTGREILIDSIGKPVELHVYNQDRKLIYVDTYDSKGRLAGGSMIPLHEFKDTIKWGEKMTGCFWFGYPLKTKATLLIGTLGKDINALDRYPMLDTLQVVVQSPNGRFYFTFQPAHAGVNRLEYKFLQPGSPWNVMPKKDSLSVDHMSGASHFFVRQSLGIRK